MKAFYIDVPILSCLCESGHGSNFYRHAIDRCWEDAPLRYKPTVMKIIREAEISGFPRDACHDMASIANDKLQNSMDPFFAKSNSAIGHLSGSVDYLMRAFSSEAGQCENVYENPYVMSIQPQPVDYFRACGYTPGCRSKCFEEISQFEEYRDRVNSLRKSVELSVTVESPFFTDPKCSHFPTCGGCKTQQLLYKEQLNQKKKQVEKIF